MLMVLSTNAKADFIDIDPGWIYNKAGFTALIGRNNICLGLDRTFKKDGCDYTICLPFSLTTEQLASSPLAGYSKLKKFVSATVQNDGTDEKELQLTLEDATSIEAGVPYIIAWSSGDDIYYPSFYGVTVTVDTPSYTQSGNVTFMETFWPFAVSANDKTKFFLNSRGNTNWPDVEGSIPAGRGFFSIGADVPSVGDGPDSGESWSTILVHDAD